MGKDVTHNVGVLANMGNVSGESRVPAARWGAHLVDGRKEGGSGGGNDLRHNAEITKHDSTRRRGGGQGRLSISMLL